MYGNHSDDPWSDPDGAMFIGNQLRACNYVGLYMKFPVAPPTGTDIGCVNQAKHIITAWGDEQSAGDLSSNPAQIKVTDSDKSTGGTHAVETYTYDSYVDRWSINYLPAYQPYFVNIVRLSQAHENTCSGELYTATSTIVIKNEALEDASALHYQVGVRDSDTICTYNTSVSVGGQPIQDATPQLVLVHQSAKRHHLLLDWELAANEVPSGTEVTITTKVELPRYNTLYYDDVKFGYGDPPVFAPAIPGFEWIIVTPGMPTPGANGGFVIGAFDLFSDAVGQTPILKTYLQHEYSVAQNPDLHYFTLRALGNWSGKYVGNVGFGYNDQELSESNLLGFTNWKQTLSGPPIYVPHSNCELSTTLVGQGTAELEFQSFCAPVPAASVWGLAAAGLIITAAGTVVLVRRRTATLR